MLEIDDVELDGPARLAAVRRVRSALPGMSVPLDALARLAARMTGAPMAVVSLVGDEEELVGRFGLPAWLADVRRAARDHTLCTFIVRANRLLAVEDMAVDADMSRHPLVTRAAVRSFAGVPLRDDAGRPVGALTAIDTTPRQWTDQQLTALTEVAEMLSPVAGVQVDAAALSLLGDPSGPDGCMPRQPVNAAVEAQVQRGFITALLDSLQVGVVAFDGDRRPVLFNRTLRYFYGLPDDMAPVEAVTQAYARLQHPDGTPVTPEEVAVVRALDGEIVRDLPGVLVAPGLPDRYLESNGQPIRSAEGEQIGAVATTLDVTERRRAERFRDCQLTIATLLNEADSVQRVAPAVTEALARSLGWAYASLWLVDDVRDVLHRRADWTAPGYDLADLLPDTIRRGQCPTGVAWDTGRPLWILDYPNSEYADSEDERDFVAACTAQGLRTVLAVPIRDGEHILGVLSCLCDAAEKDEYLLTGLVEGIGVQIGYFLARQRAAELSRQLVRAKDDFVALVGHELRTPLTSITTYSDLLLEDASISSTAQTMVEAVHRNATRLRSVVEELLDIAALESGHLGLQSQQVDLAALVVDACRYAPVRPEHQLSTALPASVHLTGDPDRLRQIVDIVLSNAAKYSPDGGVIRVELTVALGAAELAVSDDGIGVPADERAQLFHRFFRASNARHSAITGTGLGLTKARILVEAHRGSIALDPVHRTGTRVVVRLPLTPDAAQGGPTR